ncbi:Retrovirus-related Pol polyprotein from transposon 297 family [Senna tora]|uniref:Retrovirus-related Pol polyprotein from transposon 297 family n=1 Tax=Senna tora TaxID=362788 RepID=A0A834SQV1_9FABA|nr:Retrovirus-related Pol polyprotein from transposon 297 family [Senna tora]
MSNKRVMILKDSEVVTDNDSDGSIPSIEDYSDLGIEYAAEEECLVEHELNEQRENIFHTRCLVNNKVCSLIIDGGSVTNFASTTMVEILNLPIIRHPRPYKLQRLNECGEIMVDKQVLVSFSICKYYDEILCDVFPMHAGHILLGRPWEFDRKVKKDGFTDKYSFVTNDKPVTPVPLTPKQVCFVKDFSTLAAPLTEVIKKSVGFKWDKAQDDAFNKLKDQLSFAAILTLPDFAKTFEIECDASGVGIGAALMQEGKPIAYFSEKLNGGSLELSNL